MDKRKKKEIRKTKKSDTRSNFHRETHDNLKFINIDNCISIYLSPETQRYVGCRIGEDITAENPWIFVKKEKIEDSLFIFEHNSEFFSIKHVIEEYPEDTMLIGSYKTNQDIPENFLICLTTEAKFKVLEIVAKEKEALIEKVKKLIFCTANKWTSFGSEDEVIGNQNLNNRALMDVILETKLPIIIGLTKIRFKYRFASINPQSRTYTEILPDRRYYRKLIYKKRINRASQIAPKINNIESQTNLPYPKHKSTQTNEVFHVLELTEKENEILFADLKRITKFMEDSLLVNFHINFYNNDYMFKNSYIQSYARDSRELMSFHDVIKCKDLLYGSVSWNALISGIIAVSYVKRPLKMMVKNNCATNDRTNIRNLNNENKVLVWCYTDNLSAKLFMHVNFEITAISFCPYDENILVGGSSGGQIVVWDLKNKIKQVESKEYLTTTELNHRNLVQEFTTWMKWPAGVRHVFPTIISNIKYSHKSPIISIQWLPSYQHLTKLGQIETFSTTDIYESYLKPTKSYQFLTCSMEDSCVLAWQIKHSTYLFKQERLTKKKFRRLSQVPQSLNEGVSPLKKYNKDFQPFFRIKLENQMEKDKRVFITNFLLNNPKINYNALNPKTLDNYRERTFFQEKSPVDLKPHSQSFIVTSTSGVLIKCDWSKNEFDQGQSINEQLCDMNVFMGIHDGPILSCKLNPFYPECILTIGGSVFGVWITSSIKKPIFWRKGDCRYIAGLWSSDYPLLCIILRSDNYIEFWDLVDYTIKPIRRTKIKGTEVMEMISDMTRNHARKKTFLLMDLRGVIKVQDHPIFNTLLTKEEVHIITHNKLNNIIKRKKHTENITIRLKKKFDFRETNYIKSSEKIVDKPLIVGKCEIIDNKKKQKETEYKTRATKWQQKEEMRMYETLLKQRRINIEELKERTLPLIEALNKRLEQRKKIDERIAENKTIFDNEKKKLLNYSTTARRKISVSFPIEMEKIIKEHYLEDYKLIEKEYLNNIEKLTNRVVINWKEILYQRSHNYLIIRKNIKHEIENQKLNNQHKQRNGSKKIVFVEEK